MSKTPSNVLTADPTNASERKVMKQVKKQNRKATRNSKLLMDKAQRAASKTKP